MKFRLLLTFLLILSAQAKAFNRLDSLQNPKIQAGDQLVSTVGNFKLILKDNCEFEVLRYNTETTSYDLLDNYAFPTFAGQSEQNCMLEISAEDKSISSAKKSFPIGDQSKIYVRASFFIDDFGRITNLNIYQDNLQTVVQNQIMQNYPNINPLIRENLNNLNEINRNNWIFTTFGDVLIIQDQGTTKPTQYNLNGLNSNYQGIFDGDDQPLRYSSLPGITQQPKAGQSSSCSADFDGPFVYVIDPYFPIVRVYDKNKYLVLQFTHDKSGQPKSFCPSLTFQHQGNCLAKCPSGFYHQIRENTGRCVLVCEKGSKVDRNNMICSSQNDEPFQNFNKNIILDKVCPQNSEETPFGCVCSESFYDELSNRCVTAEKCQPKTLGVNGLCVACPENCLQCEIDSKFSSYLKCSQDKCMAPYTENEGVCEAITCNIPNCDQCNEQEEQCTQCSPFYYLFNNQCILECPSGTLSFVGNDGRGFCKNPLSDFPSSSNPDVDITPGNFITFVVDDQPIAFILSCPQGKLRYFENCIDTCPQSTKPQGDQCICAEQDHKFLGRNCKSTETQQTPVGLYVDPENNVYRNCPIGCNSCDKMNCLSCVPGYIQIITSSGSVCRKNSPQIVCDSEYYEYDSEKKVCAVKLQTAGNSSKCDPAIQNCELCSEKSNCINCMKDYFLHENKCLKECPQGYQKYSGLCIKTIQNCENNVIKKKVNTAKINSNIVQNSGVYKQYTKDGEQVSVDPIGSIFFMRRQLDLPESGNQLKTTIYESSSQCLLCKPGFKLEGNKCIQCASNQVSVSNRCQPCPAEGQFIVINQCRQNNCTANQIFENDNCRSCFAGFIPSENKCIRCPIGFEAENGRCERCAKDSVIVDGKCINCPKGQPKNGNICAQCYLGDIVIDNICVPCDQNSIAVDNKCKRCPFGEFANSNKCSKCPPGQIEEGEGCKKCGDNEISLDNKCQQCAPGLILRNNRCVKCPSSAVSEDNECKFCEQAFVPENNTCVMCQTKIISNDKCIRVQCLKGQIAENGICEKCPKGSISQNNICKQCQENMISKDNVCVPCQDGERVIENKCECLKRQKNDSKCACITRGKSKQCVSCKDGFLFQDKKNTQCHPSCPPNTIPEIRNSFLVCISEADSQNSQKILIDASVYKLNETFNIFFFVLNDILSNATAALNFSFNEVEVKSGSRRLLQEQDNNVSFQERSYLGFVSPSNSSYIDFSNQLRNFQSIDGNFLGTGIYGASLDNSHNNNSEDWLSIVAKIISVILIIIHAIYIGNNLLYKVDNTIIFAQTIFFFSFVKLLVGIPLAQFFNGFKWIHWAFFPNYFSGTIPSGYIEGFGQENHVPNPYRLLSIDANFIRNAGYAFSLLLTFLVAFALIYLVLVILKGAGKYEVLYPRIAKDALIAGLQFVSMAIVFWATSHLLYNDDVFDSTYFNNHQVKQIYTRSPIGNHNNFRRSCSIAAAIFLILIPIYAIVRFALNKLGGLYMFKRIIFAVILAGSSYEPEILQSLNLVSSSKNALIAALLGAQLLFIILRFSIQQPKTCPQIAMIVFEGIIMMVGYLLMYLWDDTGVTSVYLSIVLMIMVILLFEDLIDVYNDARDQFYEDDVGIVPGLMQKIPDTERNN